MITNLQILNVILFPPQRLTSDSIDVNLRIVNSVDPKAQFAAVHVASYKLCNKV